MSVRWAAVQISVLVRGHCDCDINIQCSQVIRRDLDYLLCTRGSYLNLYNRFLQFRR